MMNVLVYYLINRFEWRSDLSFGHVYFCVSMVNGSVSRLGMREIL